MQDNLIPHVQLWDASTGQGFHQYTDHQKRAWSVDFSSEAPTKLASGSDDCSVKLWSIHEVRALYQIHISVSFALPYLDCEFSLG